MKGISNSAAKSRATLRDVETVIVAGKVRKWKGRLLDVDLNRLRSQLEASRDFIYQAAGVPQNLFR